MGDSRSSPEQVDTQPLSNSAYAHYARPSLESSQDQDVGDFEQDARGSLVPLASSESQSSRGDDVDRSIDHAVRFASIRSSQSEHDTDKAADKLETSPGAGDMLLDDSGPLQPRTPGISPDKQRGYPGTSSVAVTPVLPINPFAGRGAPAAGVINLSQLFQATQAVTPGRANPVSDPLAQRPSPDVYNYRPSSAVANQSSVRRNLKSPLTKLYEQSSLGSSSRTQLQQPEITASKQRSSLAALTHSMLSDNDEISGLGLEKRSRKRKRGRQEATATKPPDRIAKLSPDTRAGSGESMNQEPAEDTDDDAAEDEVSSPTRRLLGSKGVQSGARTMPATPVSAKTEKHKSTGHSATPVQVGLQTSTPPLPASTIQVCETAVKKATHRSAATELEGSRVGSGSPWEHEKGSGRVGQDRLDFNGGNGLVMVEVAQLGGGNRSSEPKMDGQRELSPGSKSSNSPFKSKLASNPGTKTISRASAAKTKQPQQVEINIPLPMEKDCEPEEATDVDVISIHVPASSSRSGRTSTANPWTTLKRSQEGYSEILPQSSEKSVLEVPTGPVGSLRRSSRRKNVSSSAEEATSLNTVIPETSPAVGSGTSLEAKQSQASSRRAVSEKGLRQPSKLATERFSAATECARTSHQQPTDEAAPSRFKGGVSNKRARTVAESSPLIARLKRPRLDAQHETCEQEDGNDVVTSPASEVQDDLGGKGQERAVSSGLEGSRAQSPVTNGAYAATDGSSAEDTDHDQLSYDTDNPTTRNSTPSARRSPADRQSDRRRSGRRHERPREDAKDSISRRRARSKQKAHQGQRNPNRVFALFKGKSLAYHPATCLSRLRGLKYRVRFDDGTQDTVEKTSIRQLILRQGDMVKVDRPGMRTKNFVVKELVYGGANDDANGEGRTLELQAPHSSGLYPKTDIRGHSMATLVAKQRGSMSESSALASEAIEVPITELYIVHSNWANFNDRKYLHVADYLSVLPKSALPSRETSSHSTMSLASRRLPNSVGRLSTATEMLPPSTKAKTRLFSNMVFAVSFSDHKEKERVNKTVEMCGGKILEEGFNELFDFDLSPSHTQNGLPSAADNDKQCLRLKPEWSTIGFVALIADHHSTRLKFLQALALGVPCLAGQWINDCVHDKEVLNWEHYLLPSGESKHLRGAIRSRTLPYIDPETTRFADTISLSPQLFRGQSILFIAGPSDDTERCNAFLFLTYALGASSVTRKTSLGAATLSISRAQRTKKDSTGDPTRTSTQRTKKESSTWDYALYIDAQPEPESNKAKHSLDSSSSSLAIVPPGTTSHGRSSGPSACFGFSGSSSSAAAARTSKQIQNLFVLAEQADMKVIHDDYVKQSLILGKLIP